MARCRYTHLSQLAQRHVGQKGIAAKLNDQHFVAKTSSGGSLGRLFNRSRLNALVFELLLTLVMRETLVNPALLVRLKSVPGVDAGHALLTRMIERRLCINTGCAPEQYPDGALPTLFRDAVGYVPLDYAAIWWCMRPLRLSPEDVFFDVGCGMGRVLSLFARRRLRHCVGIEHSTELAQIANDNAKTLRGRKTPIDVRVDDAAEADYAGGTVFWMFNPFGASTLRQVISRIHESVKRTPRLVQIVYVRPEHEHILDSSGWLNRTNVRTVPLTWIGKATYWSNFS